MYIYKTSYIF